MGEERIILEQINKEMNQTMEEMAEAKRLNKLIMSATGELDVLKIKCSNLEEQLKKEEADVEKLKQMSFANFVHTLLNDKVEKLNKEDQEALQAKLKYDTAMAELQACQRSIEVQKARFNELSRADRRYSELMDRKKAYVEQYMPEKWNDVQKKTDDIKDITAQIKELKEAIHAGNRVKSTIDEINSALGSAENWGMWDMLGGGLISTMAKRDKMNIAQNLINSLQKEMRVFSRELKDVDTYININLQIDTFLGFADYFFDGFFVDWAVQSKIHNAQDKIRDVERQVKQLLRDINVEENQLKRKKEQMSKEIDQLIKDI